jgi:hypothetical protein
MINLRRSLEFRYYSRDYNCSGNYSFIGKSVIVQPLNYNEPTHIHLAYTDRIDQMFVSYPTNSSQYTFLSVNMDLIHHHLLFRRVVPQSHTKHRICVRQQQLS